jgi:hypothetical protein
MTNVLAIEQHQIIYEVQLLKGRTPASKVFALLYCQQHSMLVPVTTFTASSNRKPVNWAARIYFALVKCKSKPD